MAEGRTGKAVCCFVPDFEPYFYLKASGDLHAVARLVKDTFEQVKKVEIVEKFEPVGYQKDKQKMLKVTTNLPRDVPEIRDDILKTPGCYWKPKVNGKFTKLTSSSETVF